MKRRKSTNAALKLAVVLLVSTILLSGTSLFIDNSSGMEYRPFQTAVNATTPGYVVKTLVLFNNTVLKGNAQTSTNGSVSPFGIAYDPANGYLYVTDFNSSKVAVVNPVSDRVIAWTEVGENPIAVAYDPSDRNMYVANYGSGNVSVINSSTNAVIESIPAGTGPHSLAYDPGTGNMYVANWGSHSALSQSTNITVISSVTGKAIASIPVPLNPHTIAYDPSNGYMYVTITNNEYIEMINTTQNRIIRTFSFIANHNPGQSYIEWPTAITYDPANGNMYAISLSPVSLIIEINSTTNVLTQVSDGVIGFGAAFNPQNQYLYFLYNPLNGLETGGVSAFDTNLNSTAAHLYLGKGPAGIAYDPDNGLLYVTNSVSGTLSAIRTVGPDTISFAPSGLSNGARWKVTVNGITEFVNSGSASFNLPDGTYSFSIVPPGGYIMLSPASVSASLTGNQITIHVNFISTYLLAAIIAGGLAAIALVVIYRSVRKKRN